MAMVSVRKFAVLDGLSAGPRAHCSGVNYSAHNVNIVTAPGGVRARPGGRIRTGSVLRVVDARALSIHEDAAAPENSCTQVRRDL